MLDDAMKKYICKECGSEFESRGYNVFYCAPCRKKKRQQISHNAYRRTHPAVYTDKTCKVCGKDFRGTKFDIFCSPECAEKGKDIPSVAALKDSYLMYLPKGYKAVIDELKRNLGFPSVSDLLKASLKEYLDNHLTDEDLKKQTDNMEL